MLSGSTMAIPASFDDPSVENIDKTRFMINTSQI